MERTQSLIACTSTAQGDILGHYIYDIGSVDDSVYGGLVNHWRRG